MFRPVNIFELFFIYFPPYCVEDEYMCIKIWIKDKNFMELWIWVGQYTLNNGNKLSGWVWATEAKATGLNLIGYLNGTDMRMLDNSSVATLINFKQGVKIGETFSLKFSTGKEPYQCSVYDVDSTNPGVSLKPQLIQAAPNQPQQTQFPTNGAGGMQQRIQIWMNQQGIDAANGSNQ